MSNVYPGPERDPLGNSSNDVVSTTQARQAQTGLGVRYVLAISLSAALAAMAVVYFIYFAP
jgi:hypothetical protein